jgi:hypothetical protein
MPIADIDVPTSEENSFVDQDQPASLNTTIVLSKPSVLTDDDRRLNFVLTSVDENKENVSSPKPSAPIAMVSPMTSNVVANAFAKTKKALKKTLNHPVASTSNLRAAVDLKPSVPKPRLVLK